MMNEVTFRIKRFSVVQETSWWQEYRLTVHPGMTILEGLWHIVRYIDGSLSFRYSCRGGVCGSCAMVINKQTTLACHTQVASQEAEVIEIEPLPRMTVLKDLVVDLKPFLNKFKSIQPVLRNEQPRERELLQSPESRSLINDSAKCIMCASCPSACPLLAVDHDYLGPAVLTAAHRFAFDDRNEDRDRMLSCVNDTEGALGCRTISRCTEVCPKSIDPSIRIKEMRKKIRADARSGKLKRNESR